MGLGLAVVIQSAIVVAMDGFILTRTFINRKRGEKQRVFSLFALSVTILQVMSLLVRMYKNDFIPLNVMGRYIVHIVLFFFIALPPCFCFEYLLLVSGRGFDKITRKNHILVMIPALIIGFLSLISPWTHWIFYIDENLMFQDGPIWFARVICPYYYFAETIVLLAYAVVRALPLAKRKMFMNYLSFIIPSLAGSILQGYAKALDAGYQHIGVSVGLMFLYVQLYMEEQSELDRLKAVEDINEKLVYANKEKEAQIQEISQLNDLLNEEKETERMKNSIIKSLGNMFFGIYYVDICHDTYKEIDVKNDFVKSRFSKEGNAQEALNIMVGTMVSSDFQKVVHEFVDLNTLASRLKSLDYVSMEFVGEHFGWIEAYFITVDRDVYKTVSSVVFALRVINDIKERERILIDNSYRDKLTGLYNRRMYEENLCEQIDAEEEKDFVYASIDLNGLKQINDTYGHYKGDEILVRAANCLRQSLGIYGRIYRAGGDEFVSMFFATKEQLDSIKKDLETSVSEANEGEEANLSLSCGFASRVEFPETSIMDLSKIADKRMYEAKEAYYQKSGKERRRR